jgi:hypothetical protein
MADGTLVSDQMMREEVRSRGGASPALLIILP